MRIRSRFAHAALLLCLFGSTSFAQSSDSPPPSPQDATPQAAPAPQTPPPEPAPPVTAPHRRPRIGVALEGGGALGLAHVGVLQWFEDHHIAIDYLAGTSMGGLVGGLYATGKSPAQLRDIVERQDWDAIIDGQLRFQDLSYRRKEDARAYPNRLEFGLKHGFSLPSGLNTGQGVSLLIDQETLAYAHYGSFDSLPIPFRCVATDLVSSDLVVFDHGSIAEAMRATMSLPGVFAPVRDGDHVYVDGGLLGNLPSDVVRRMGANIVIAVHLETAPRNPAEIQSLFSVLGRSVEVVIHENEERGLAQSDLVVNVDLKEFSSIDYNKAETIINRGTQAAEAKADLLAPYQLDQPAWDAYLAQRKQRIRTEIPVPQFVEIRGIDPQHAPNLVHFLQPLAGKPIDVPVLQERLNRLTGIGRFDSANYWLEEKDDKTGLIVFLHEKSYAPPTVQLAFDVDGSETNNVTFTQSGRLTFMDVAGYRSEWRTDFSFGHTYAVSTELYRPFNPVTKWFAAPHFSASNAGLNFFQKNEPVALYRLYQVFGGVDVGYGFSRFTELRAGYQIGYANAHLSLGRPDFTSISGRVGDSRLRFFTDHTDDPIVPRRGWNTLFNFNWYDAYPGVSGGLPAADARIQGFLPVSRKGSIWASADGGTSFGVHDAGAPLYFLGSPLRLSAYGTNELFGTQFYLFRAGYIHELLTLPPFVGKKVFFVSAWEHGKMYDFRPQTKFPTDVAGGVLAETALGPLFIGGSIGDSGHQKWFFQLGRVF